MRASKQESKHKKGVETSHLWFQTTENDIPSIVSGNLISEHRQGESQSIVNCPLYGFMSQSHYHKCCKMLVVRELPSLYKASVSHLLWRFGMVFE